ncbi:MAG: aspartate kinase [Candidatus Izimaplasma sp.]|nr:aspartate kinase [Candidatus Izimaplasma bacterium]
MNDKLVVCKFGGSSVASSQHYQQVKRIIDIDSNRKVVVVSAPGKTDTMTTKVTDLLYLIYEHKKYNSDYTTLLKQVHKRFSEIKDNLNLTIDIDRYFEALKNTLKKETVSRDWLVSRGEYLNAKLMSDYLGYTFVDAYNHLFVNYDKQFDYDQTEDVMQSIDIDKGIVMPGFYATTPNHHVTLLSRGGSDTTASIIAYALNASAYENFTDVDGVYVTDPSIVPNAQIITNLSYNEIKELAYRGAKLFHQEAITPVAKKDIPIIIKNTINPTAIGTVISNQDTLEKQIVTAISGKQDFTIFNITKDGDYSKTKTLQAIITVFMQHHVEIEHMPSGIDSFSVIVRHDQVDDVKFTILSQLNDIEGIDTIDIEEDLALIAVVGKHMARTPGVAGQLFGQLGEANINIKVIAQSSTELSVIVGVDHTDYKTAIQTIYQTFFN